MERTGKKVAVAAPLTPARFIESNAAYQKTIGMRPLDAMTMYAQAQGISPDLALGVYQFAVRWNLARLTQLAPTLQFLDDLHEIAGSSGIFKSKSFNYLSDKPTATETFSDALGNARYMIGLVGPEVFGREGPRRSTAFRAPIANSDFFLSCKGGSGAGAFSLDFAIGIDKGQEHTSTAGELWRTGIDTEDTDEGPGKTVRIIRTGSGVKKDLLKMEKFLEFRRKFKTSPPRALAFLALYFAHSLGAEHLKALSTQGALKLSSLSRSKDPYDYSQLFEGVGFSEDGENKNWLSITNLQENFHDAIRTTPGGDQNGLRSYEASGIHEVLDAFENLRGPDGNPFPVKLMLEAQDKSETERVLATFSDIHGWRK